MSIKAFIPVFLVLFCGCSEYYPRPKAYLRVDAPLNYQIAECFSFSRFETAAGTTFLPERKTGNEIWANIFYPAYNAEVYGAYCRFAPGGLDKLTGDFYKLMERNMRDEEIHYALYEDHGRSVYAHIFRSEGPVASPVQFFVTDSTSRYFRGAVYFPDSLSHEKRMPYIRFMGDEMEHLLETFSWK